MTTSLPCDRFDWERALRRRQLPSGVGFCAAILASYGDQNGTRIRPGEQRLAADMGCTVRTVRRHLAFLREAGLIERVRAGHRRSGQADEYRLTIPVDNSGDGAPYRTQVTGMQPSIPDTGDRNAAVHTGHSTTSIPDTGVRPPSHLPTTTHLGNVTTDRARVAAPPKFCPRHPDGTDQPCRACAEARELHDRAESQRRAEAEAWIAWARGQPDCPHGQPGGNLTRPTLGTALCPQCRRTERRTA